MRKEAKIIIRLAVVSVLLLTLLSFTGCTDYNPGEGDYKLDIKLASAKGYDFDEGKEVPKDDPSCDVYYDNLNSNPILLYHH